MWPIWLIVAIIGGGVLTIVSTAVFAVYIDRKRRHVVGNDSSVNRNLSQYHGPHLSINDFVDSSLPRQSSNLRHSLGHGCRDSRFYSAVVSERERKAALPEEKAATIDASPSRDTATGNGTSQWLSPAKVNSGLRKKKIIKLSITAPMARVPCPIVEPAIDGPCQPTPTLAELSADMSPKMTPKSTAQSAPPAYPSNCMSSQVISQISPQKHSPNAQSDKRGGPSYTRSPSIGSMKGNPPDCPLPPLPRDAHPTYIGGASMIRPESDIRADRLGMPLLCSAYTGADQSITRSKVMNEDVASTNDGLSDFRFGLEDDLVQVVKVDSSEQLNRASSYTANDSKRPDSIDQVEPQQPECVDNWHHPRWQTLSETSSPSVVSPTFESRPVSAISLSDRWMSSNLLTRGTYGGSRPVSGCSSIDVFCSSVSPQASNIVSDSARAKGHRRQNCIRISGLTQVEQTKHRLSSHLDRLTEAEETDDEDVRSLAIEIPTISPAKSLRSAENYRNVDKRGPGVKRFQTKDYSGRNHRDLKRKQQDHMVRNFQQASHNEDLAENRGNDPNAAQEQLSSQTVLYPDLQRQPSNPLHFSPKPSKLGLALSETRNDDLGTRIFSDPASISALTTFPVVGHLPSNHSDVHRLSSRLHGPRKIPAQSLRTRNRKPLGISQHERSRSPARKTSLMVTKPSQRSAAQDEVKRSLVLLQNLAHAARSPSGLPEMRIVTSPNTDSQANNSQSSTVERLRLQGPRQRSRTLGFDTLPSTFDSSSSNPGITHSGTDATRTRTMEHSPSAISIWEDLSARDSAESFRPEFKPVKSPQLQKESLWRLQQNADIITSRALAFGSNGNAARSPKISKNTGVLDSYFDIPQELTRERSSSNRKKSIEASHQFDIDPNVPRSRKRSHTVAARPHLYVRTDAKGGTEALGFGLNVVHTSSSTVLATGTERDGRKFLR